MLQQAQAWCSISAIFGQFGKHELRRLLLDKRRQGKAEKGAVMVFFFERKFAVIVSAMNRVFVACEQVNKLLGRSAK